MFGENLCMRRRRRLRFRKKETQTKLKLCGAHTTTSTMFLLYILSLSLSLSLLMIPHYIDAAPCPSGTCRHTGTNCVANCSTAFCLCDTNGVGALMTTANGTVCYDDFQVYATDDRCIPISTALAPSPAPSISPNPNPNPYPPCTCVHPGVECAHRCDPHICLCGSSLTGSLLPTAPSTVCVDGYQVWEASQVCSASSSSAASSSATASICPTDGFYCMGHCSLSYYMCSNGMPSATLLVPYGTVCGSTPNATDELIYPTECNATNVSCASAGSSDGLQCISDCGTTVQICVENVGYALQTVPSGLLCYNNQLVLSSQPACALSNMSATAASISFDVSILAENTIWSILSDNAVAASVVDSIASASALSSVPSNVQITQSMVAVAVAVSSTTNGRRMSQSQGPIQRQVSIYAPPSWDSSVVLEILNDSTGSSLLADALLFRSYEMTRTTTTSPSTTPSLSPIANLHVDAPNGTAHATGVESVVLGASFGCGIFLLVTCFLCRRYWNQKEVETETDAKTEPYVGIDLRAFKKATHTK